MIKRTRTLTPRTGASPYKARTPLTGTAGKTITRPTTGTVRKPTTGTIKPIRSTGAAIKPVMPKKPIVTTKK